MWWAPLAIHGAKILAGFMQEKNDQSLGKAVQEDDLASAAVALYQGANPNIGDSSGIPILYYAIDTGDAKLVKLLIDKGASIAVEAPEGRSPLMYAITRQHMSIVELLIERGCSVSQFSHATGGFPINEAAMSCHLEISRFLLSHGADANSRNLQGHTPLLTILAYQAMPIISPVYAQSDDYKETAELINLDRNNMKKLIKVLLDAGANPSLAELNGLSALMLAAVLGEPDLIALLCDHGAKVNSTTTEGQTAFMAAAQFGKVDALKELHQRGANVHAKDADQETALDIARSQSQHDVVTFLTECC